jgi:transposase, IS30 family
MPRGKRAGSKTHGRLRRWLPPQIDIDKVSDQKMQDIVITTTTLTPRKCLGFKTPLLEILEKLGKEVQSRFA